MWDSLYLICLPDAPRFYEQYALKTLNLWLFVVYALFLNESFSEVHISVSLCAPPLVVVLGRYSTTQVGATARLEFSPREKGVVNGAVVSLFLCS